VGAARQLHGRKGRFLPHVVAAVRTCQPYALTKLTRPFRLVQTSDSQVVSVWTHAATESSVVNLIKNAVETCVQKKTTSPRRTRGRRAASSAWIAARSPNARVDGRCVCRLQSFWVVLESTRSLTTRLPVCLTSGTNGKALRAPFAQLSFASSVPIAK